MRMKFLLRVQITMACNVRVNFSFPFIIFLLIYAVQYSYLLFNQPVDNAGKS